MRKLNLTIKAKNLFNVIRILSDIRDKLLWNDKCRSEYKDDSEYYYTVNGKDEKIDGLKRSKNKRA